MKPPGLRRFHGLPVSRLIVSVTVAQVQEIDSLLRRGSPSWAGGGNRSEFVRLAIAEKLMRDAAETLVAAST